MAKSIISLLSKKGRYIVFFVAIPVGLFLYLSSYIFHIRFRSEDPYIEAIIQTGPEKEALKSAYFAELFGLSERVCKASEFDVKEANKILTNVPFIQEGHVEIKEGGVLYIDYVARKPIALLYDFPNVALDAQRFAFPITPFFSPKQLPEIYLDLKEPLRWNHSIEGDKSDLAFKILKIFEGSFFHAPGSVLRRVDVSNASLSSCGRKEIVLLIEHTISTCWNGEEIRVVFPHLLRLSVKKHLKELSNYFKLQDRLAREERAEVENSLKDLTHQPEGKYRYAKTKVVDFRVSHLAFIEEIDSRELYADTTQIWQCGLGKKHGCKKIRET